MNKTVENQLTDRTPMVIAAEINSIKDQARAMILSSSIEIGRRLVEAKAMLPHGEWGGWLEKSVDYSQKTAENLMRIYEEYGQSNSKLISNLSYTKAVALLGVPAEEREEFAQGNDILNITVRKLHEAIQEKKALEEKLQTTEDSLNEARKETEAERQSRQKLSDSYDGLQQTAERLRKELEEAKVSGNLDEIERLSQFLAKTENELVSAHQKIEELERQIKETPVEVTTATTVIEKVPEEIEREIEELRRKTQEFEAQPNQQVSEDVLRFRVYFDSLVKGFDNLLKALAEITNPEKREEYKSAVNKLIGMMQGRL